MSLWADFLQRTLGPGPAAQTATRHRVRVPFKFTSDLSLSNSPRADLGIGIVQSRDIAFNGASVASPGNSGTLASSGTVITVLQGSTIAPDFYGMVKMAINPQSIKWQQAKRFVKRDTMAGSTYMHFLNKKFQDNDMLRLEFSGVTGNIALYASSLPNRPLEFTQDTNGYEKLVRFHQLWNLTRQAKIFLDDSRGLYVDNHQYIIYESQMLPFPVILTGFYDRVLEFEESADKPNQIRYSFSFIVTNTSPDIDNLATAIGNA